MTASQAQRRRHQPAFIASGENQERTRVYRNGSTYNENIAYFGGSLSAEWTFRERFGMG
jgi:hypothetical protein